MSVLAGVIDTTASPRLYRRHQRYARIARMRYSRQAREFIVDNATRLSGASYESTLFGKLTTNTAAMIVAADGTDDLL
jgi:hypothetical protein